jgi:O-antigen ligase
MFITVLFLVIASMLNGNSIGAICGYLSIFAVIYYFRIANLNDNLIKFIVNIGLIIMTYLLVISKYVSDMFYLYDKTIINPNIVGSGIFILLVYIVSFGDKLKISKYIKVTLGIVCLIVEYVLECRTGMAVVILFGIFKIIVPQKIWNNKKLIIMLSLLVMVAGFLFPFIYVQLNKTIIARYVYKLTGKSFYTGRELIWQRLINAVVEKPVAFWIGLGSGYEYAIGQGYSMHNFYLGIFLDCGIIGTVIMITFILSQINYMYKNGNFKQFQTDLIKGYICLLVYSYAEGTIGVQNTIIICNMMLGIAANKKLYQN